MKNLLPNTKIIHRKFNIFHQINDIMEKVQTRNILDKREVQILIKSQKYTLLSQKTNLFSRILII